MAVVIGVRALPLRGATPDGGWQGDSEGENVTPDELHCLIEVTTDVGIGGLGCVEPPWWPFFRLHAIAQWHIQQILLELGDGFHVRMADI